jgi:large subunit ribosomal protein L4
MASVAILDHTGAEVGKAELNDNVFGAEFKDALVHQVVVAYQNNKRQGNAETKTRREVRGGGAKPFRQKGTGNARRGSSREPIMRGGGTVFGPHKRSYRTPVPLKMKRNALRCVLSDRVRNEQMRVVRLQPVETPRTKPVAEWLGKVAPAKGRTLIVTESTNGALWRSVRNLPKVEVVTAADVNALDILLAGCVLVEEGAVSKIEERLS